MTHLRAEKSPYLLQHVDNPVDWYPWAEQAFVRAREDNKLIFLSIGYSTCHWCHVMAHECFEDEEVADLLNGDYISIKVDREERPDIDQVYMEVCQRLTGSGGWPLTIIMTPDARPFYAATYIPKSGRQGRPGLMELLPWVTGKWHDTPELFYDAAREVVAELQHRNEVSASGTLSLAQHDQAVRALKNSYDRRFGGFGRAPKFPRPHDLLFLLQHSRTHDDNPCLEMVEQTLQKMRCGGIYDQLGAGFHRYSTDERWLVPHFEKMLYDQAGLVVVYLEAWHLTGEEVYALTVAEVLTYLQRDMLSPEEAFYSAEDADSEGEEGTFYLWSKAELDALLKDRSEDFCRAYDVKAAGNYHDEVSGQLTGKNILYIASQTGDVKGIQQQFETERNALFAARTKRPRPHLDDKIITAWNGMMVSALVAAGRSLHNQDYINRAVSVSEFIQERMVDDRGRLFRRYRQSEAAIEAFSEDYAYLSRGLLDLYAYDFDPKWLDRAMRHAGVLIDFFQDPQNGRLYDTPIDGEKLLIRPMSTFDGAMPSAGSVALEVFARLYLLSGDHLWLAAAEKLMQSLSSEILRYPAGYTQALIASKWLLSPTREIVIVGDPGDNNVSEMLNIVRNSTAGQTVALFKSPDYADSLARLAPFVATMQAVDGHAAAYVCQGFSCQKPLHDPRELRELLETKPG